VKIFKGRNDDGRKLNLVYYQILQNWRVENTHVKPGKQATNIKKEEVAKETLKYEC
jgi:hypothetical protein